MSQTIHAGMSYDAGVPDGYVCGTCGASGVRLYREYQTFLSHQSLLCRSCTLASMQSDEREQFFDSRKWLPHDYSIGWRVLAVPTREGDTYWGYTSIPLEGLEWWKRLPISVDEAQP